MKIIKILFLLVFSFSSFLKFDFASLIYTDVLSTKGVRKIDSHVERVAKRYGGSFYSQELAAFVPEDPERIRRKWKKYKDTLAERIGYIPNQFCIQRAVWKNSAQTVDELLEDAHKAAFDFRKKCELVAAMTGGSCSFGPQNKMICKSKASAERKIAKDVVNLNVPCSYAVEKLSDVLRGSIIVSQPEQISKVAGAIKKVFASHSDHVLFRNLWQEERESGYVAIHAKILFPVPGNKYEKYVIAEIQIHLDSIVNGSMECVKEREHLLYEKVREGSQEAEPVSAASTLLYLSAFKQKICFK